MTPRLTDHEMRIVDVVTECLSAIFCSSGSFSNGESAELRHQRQHQGVQADDVLVDPRGQYASRRIPLESQYSLSACEGLYGCSSTYHSIRTGHISVVGAGRTWLTAGTTIQVLDSFSSNGTPKFDTPIALAFPDARIASICFHVSAWSHSQSMLREPSGRVGKRGLVPFSTVRLSRRRISMVRWQKGMRARVHGPVNEVEVEVVRVERFESQVEAILNFVMVCAPAEAGHHSCMIGRAFTYTFDVRKISLRSTPLALMP